MKLEEYQKAIDEIRGYATLISEDEGGTPSGAHALFILMNLSKLDELMEKLYDQDLADGLLKAESTE